MRPPDDEAGGRNAGVGVPSTVLGPPITAIGVAFTRSPGDGCLLGIEVDSVPIDPTELNLCRPTTVFVEKGTPGSC